MHFDTTDVGLSLDFWSLHLTSPLRKTNTRRPDSHTPEMVESNLSCRRSRTYGWSRYFLHDLFVWHMDTYKEILWRSVASWDEQVVRFSWLFWSQPSHELRHLMVRNL